MENEINQDKTSSFIINILKFFIILIGYALVILIYLFLSAEIKLKSIQVYS